MTCTPHHGPRPWPRCTAEAVGEYVLGFVSGLAPLPPGMPLCTEHREELLREGWTLHDEAGNCISHGWGSDPYYGAWWELEVSLSDGRWVLSPLQYRPPRADGTEGEPQPRARLMSLAYALRLAQWAKYHPQLRDSEFRIRNVRTDDMILAAVLVPSATPSEVRDV